MIALPRLRAATVVPVSIVALAFAAIGGCSSPTTNAQSAPPGTPAAATTTATPAPSVKATEVDHAEPRLVVTTKDSALVLNAADHETLGTFPTEGTANRVAVGSNERTVYLTSMATGVTLLLDSGSYASAHGDHSHFYVKAPALLDQRLQGGEPVHQVTHEGRTSIFYDKTGVADVLTDSLTVPGPAKVTAIKTAGPQHGVVIPMADGYLATIAPTQGENPLPTGVARLDDDGKQVAAYDSCPQLHGEAAVADVAVFGCAKDVLLVDEHGSQNLPLPKGATDRVGQFHATAGSSIIVGDLDPDSLALVDVNAKKVTEYEVGATVAGITRTPNGDAVVLTEQGEVIVINPESGEEEARVKAIEPFVSPEAHDAPRPRVVVTGDEAHVTDPAHATLVRVSLDGDAKPVITPLPAAPVALVATNTSHAGEEGHSH